KRRGRYGETKQKPSAYNSPAEATATTGVSWGEPCSAEAKAKIEKCMKDESGDIDKCCPILHSVIDNSCPCWVHAKITDTQLANLYFIYCDIVHPLCSTAHQLVGSRNIIAFLNLRTKLGFLGERSLELEEAE
ncbi:hypothetical protein HAX54_037288, partial [Datura stramonium]|nr:hypothetical protein [Datura stramonium]